MLGEEKTHSKFKSFILKILFVVLMLFILIWLFPTKGFINQKLDESVNKNPNDSVSQTFSENTQIMGNAAKNYFTGSRLPVNGGRNSITLGEMFDRHLIVEFTDSKGVLCDRDESYVEVINDNGEYTMKVNLSCSDIKDYVVIYLNNEDDTNLNEVASKETNSKKTNTTWSEYSDWSAWQIEKIEKTDYNKVETKTEKVYIGTKTVAKESTQKHASTKQEVKKYICDGSYDNQGIYENKTTCVKSSEPKEEMRAKKVYICDSTHDNEGIYTKYTKCINNDDPKLETTVTYVCPKGYNNAGVYTKETTCNKTVTSYVKENQYKTVTYYRQQTRTVLSES